VLDLQVLRFPSGRSEPRLLEDWQELLYVAAGTGTLHLGEASHELEPDTAALLLPGESYEIETGSALELISVRAAGGAALERKRVTMRLADRPEQRADEQRTFRVLYETNVTQFVGVVAPCRAPDHSHPYDEVGYILEGRGFAHIAGESTRLGPGSRFHLAPGEVHCIENSGPGPMRILGVFYPAGSPAQRS
jgi:quercetin dioxygenase-like cupin family protein